VRSRGIILAILVVVSAILVVSVSVVTASELVPTRMLTLELPAAITVVAIITLVCVVAAIAYKQRLITIHYTRTRIDTVSNPQAVDTAMPIMDQPTAASRMPYPNYCDRCGQRLA